jgi:TM2 domain-containing membrane protein YozV
LKNPGVAAVLSFLITGLGQVYNGSVAKGIVLFLIQIVNLALMSFFVGYITFIIVWIYGIVAAYTSAGRINAQRPSGVSH